MQVTQIGTLYQLTFLPRVMPINCYLVDEGEGLTLIDCALPYSAAGIMRTAAEIGKPITRIALTHAHGDHIGALDALAAQLPNAEIFISARDARLLRGDRSLDPNEPQTPLRGSIPKPGAIKTSPTAELREGDQVGSLTVIATPGHTPGSVSFLQENTGVLIAGDAMQTRGGIAVAGKTQLVFPFPAMATWNKTVALTSARRLLELKPSMLAIGHGKLLSQPTKHISHAIQAAEQSFVLA